MRDSKLIYLSYTLIRNTPNYGDRNRFRLKKRIPIKGGGTIIGIGLRFNLLNYGSPLGTHY